MRGVARRLDVQSAGVAGVFVFVQLPHDGAEYPEYTEFALKDAEEDAEDRKDACSPREYERATSFNNC